MNLFGRVLNPYETWLTADIHSFHNNLCEGSSKWDDKSECRPFSNAREMNEVVLSNINEVVKPNHTLINIGDVCLGRLDDFTKFLSKINCKNHHLIFGNHDKRYYFVDSFTRLFASTQFYLEFYSFFDKDKWHINCFHYAGRVWNKSHHGSILCYAHSHGSLPSFGRSLDVGVDTNDFRPYLLADIINWARQRKIEFVDHHGE